MFRQDRTNPSTAISNWRGRLDSKKGWPSTAVSTWLNGGLFGAGAAAMAGYLFGGSSGTLGNYLATGSKWTFPDEVKSAIAGALPQGVTYTSGFSNNNVAGYTGAGYGGGSWPDLSKWMYASDTRVDLTDLPNARYGVGSCGDTGVAGWIVSGSEAVMNSNADKIAFATDVRTFHANWTSANVYVGDVSQNSGTAGYYAGGIRATQSDVVDKFTFSSETTATLGSIMTCAAYYTRCTANQGTAMYIFNGNLCTTVVNKLAFASDTISSLSSGLSTARSYIGVMGNKDVAIYAADAGGTTNFDRWAMPSDTRTTITGGSDRDSGPSGFSNQDWS